MSLRAERGMRNKKNPRPRERGADLLLHQTNHMKKKFILIFNSCCKGRIRTSTGQLAARQSARAGGQPPKYLAFIPLSPPPRQGGMAANFNTSQFQKITHFNHRILNIL